MWYIEIINLISKIKSITKLITPIRKYLLLYNIFFQYNWYAYNYISPTPLHTTIIQNNNR